MAESVRRNEERDFWHGRRVYTVRNLPPAWYDTCVRQTIAATVVVLLAASTAAAQSASTRAWQQRLEVSIPLPVPIVELESINPFATEIDEAAVLEEATLPRKVDIVGTVVIAAYVDSKGECLGIVPLELPFPGLTAALAGELTGSRFEPAMAGSAPQPSWVVLEIVMEGRVKDGSVADQVFELPDPDSPPVAQSRGALAPPGRLQNLTATPPSQLNQLAQPRRLRVSAPGREDEIPIRALVHITEDGRCDRYVPLELDDGLDNWLSAYLATWKARPARVDGKPVGSWLVYSARATLKLSSIGTADYRVAKSRIFTPPS